MLTNFNLVLFQGFDTISLKFIYSFLSIMAPVLKANNVKLLKHNEKTEFQPRNCRWIPTSTW